MPPGENYIPPCHTPAPPDFNIDHVSGAVSARACEKKVRFGNAASEQMMINIEIWGVRGLTRFHLILCDGLFFRRHRSQETFFSQSVALMSVVRCTRVCTYVFLYGWCMCVRMYV